MSQAGIAALLLAAIIAIPLVAHAQEGTQHDATLQAVGVVNSAQFRCGFFKQYATAILRITMQADHFYGITE
jgi:hypothetical protein